MTPRVDARRLTCCVDIGSTFTKAALVDLDDGTLVATASHPTTLSSDVLRGVDACRAELGAGDEVRVLACSSAGGGLRLAVVGHERVVTAEAGHRVGLSAGARIVHVSAGQLDRSGVAALLADRPDVVLLVGGTDGGNSEVLLHNARALAASRLRVPVVAAGNSWVGDEVVAEFSSRGRTVVAAPNVLPRIGVLEPDGARTAIRDVFIRHVIGGKKLSRGPRLGRLVRAATPDAVLAGVELLADGSGPVRGAGGVLVVDVGGATADVYSVLVPDEEAELRREVVDTMWRSRTVEGDLGMRWSAVGVVEAALSEGLLDAAGAAALAGPAAARAAAPSFVPASADDRAVDLRLATLAVTVALRRHARPTARNLRRTALVLGSGGVLRHASSPDAQRILAPVTTDLAGGWRLPESPAVVVDARYVLAAAGLIGLTDPDAGARLLSRTLLAPT